MNEAYGVKGRVHKLEQRKARAFSLSELPSLAGLRNLDSFDVEFSPSGQILRIANFNMAGNPIGAEHFVYDASGRTIRCIESDETGRETSLTDFVYESEERRITSNGFPAMTLKAESQVYGLNAEGKPLGDGRYTYEYDDEGRQIRVWSFNEFAEDDVANGVTVYEYETDGTGNWIERREFHRFRSDPHWIKQVTTRNLT